MVFYRVVARDCICSAPHPVTRWLRTLWYVRKILRDYEMRHLPCEIWIESCAQLEFVLD